MTIQVQIQNGKEKSKTLEIDDNSSALVSDTGLPPAITGTATKPFSILMSTSAGVTDMRVDGSVTPVDFLLSSSDEGERYIHTLAITIADAGATLNKFGNIAALTNGCDLILQDEKLGDVIVSKSLKSNFDFVQMCSFKPYFGDGTAAFRASNVVGASEAYVPILDIDEVFGMKHALRISKDSPKKLILRVNDALGGIDRFDIRAFGYDVISI